MENTKDNLKITYKYFNIWQLLEVMSLIMQNNLIDTSNQTSLNKRLIWFQSETVITVLYLP